MSGPLGKAADGGAVTGQQPQRRGGRACVGCSAEAQALTAISVWRQVARWSQCDRKGTIFQTEDNLRSTVRNAFYLRNFSTVSTWMEEASCRDAASLKGSFYYYVYFLAGKSESVK